MIVDAHLHLFHHGYGQFGSGKSPLGELSDLEAYEGLRKRNSIAAGLVVCYEDHGIDPANNAYVRELAAGRPWIHSVAYLRPSPAPTRRQLESLIAAGHCGIALYLPDEAAAVAVLEWPAQLWQALSDVHAVISLNARPEGTKRLRPLVEQFGNCAFIFSHLGLPGRHETAPDPTAAAERLGPLIDLAALPNVGVKLSGLYAIDPRPPHATALPFIDLLLERFDASNLHWGSDFSPALEFVSFEETMELPRLASLPERDRALILGDGLSIKLRRAGQANP